MAQPLIYAAAEKELGKRHVPQQALVNAIELQCCCCKTAVLALRDSLAATFALANRSDRRVAVLCTTCFQTATADLDETLLLHYSDTEIESLLAKHFAEIN